MKSLAATILSLSVLASACSHASPAGRVAASDTASVGQRTESAPPRSEVAPPMPTLADIRVVAPALEKYTQDRLLGEVWKRPGLADRKSTRLNSSHLVISYAV